MIKTEQRTRVWTTKGVCLEGVVRIGKSGMTFVHDSGMYPSKDDIAFYEVRRNVLNHGNEILAEPSSDLPIRVRFTPLLITERLYADDMGQVPEKIFPLSSEGFHGRIIQGTEPAVFVVQEIENDTRLWLTIISYDEKQVYEAHRINPYEFGILELIDDDEFRRRRLETMPSRSGNHLWNQLAEVLDEPSPSSEEISFLKEDVLVPNLTISGTARETMSRLVPVEFPNEIRDEMILFLALVFKKTIPSEDPVSFFSGLLSFPLLRGLLILHTQCILDGVKEPPYIKLMTLAARGQLHVPKRIQQETTEDQSWIVFWKRAVEMGPDWRHIGVKYALQLERSGRISLKLPISKVAASKSRRSWRERLGLLSTGLLIRATVDPQAIGLRQMAYIGAAYRWPHRHMSWTARLGSASDHASHMQIMVMPPSAVERVKRFLPSSIEIGWSSRAVNLVLFDRDTNLWNVDVTKIVESVSKTSTKARLVKQFGSWSGEKIHLPSLEEVKVLDVSSNGVYLADTEIPQIAENLNVSDSKIRSVLARLSKLGILKTAYEIIDYTLIALVIIAQGSANQICSLVGSFLENSPTSLAMLNDISDQCIIISRFPEETIYDLVKSLTSAGRRSNLAIRCIRPSSIKSYTHNLYERLLREDGTWDDDVTAFLSQARSKRRELSEREIEDRM